ncbi:MAG: hypothetical protein EOM12_05720 [Verrucomicrobiae bacterium]|nr:hypothetical protein [Verrucomicrobiae bacterium]
MKNAMQLTLFDDGKDAQFCEWKSTPGGRHILRRYIYPLVAQYAVRYKRTGQRVSMKLIWELVRDKMKVVRHRAQQRGIKIVKLKGYALNNDLTAYVARNIYDDHPDWRGMFELRAADKDGMALKKLRKNA